MNQSLEKKSFLISNSRATLADISLFYSIRPEFIKKDANKTLLKSYPSLVRWFDQLQNWQPIREVLGKESIIKFDMPLDIFASSNSKENNNNNNSSKKKENSKTTVAEAGQNKKEGKKEKKEKKKNTPPAATNQPEVTKLDIRVGLITKCWKHETADKLYCEEIDVGEESVRPIASGLFPFYKSADEIQGRKVLVLCNLKPRNLAGYRSNGMVLCASNSDHTQVELVDVPEGAKVGERITFQGVEGTFDALSPAQIAKKKVFEAVAPNLKTDGGCVPGWVDADKNFCKFMTTAGPCSVKSIKDGGVS